MKDLGFISRRFFMYQERIALDFIRYSFTAEPHFITRLNTGGFTPKLSQAVLRAIIPILLGLQFRGIPCSILGAPL
jgi:hypothetical protein